MCLGSIANAVPYAARMKRIEDKLGVLLSQKHLKAASLLGRLARAEMQSRSEVPDRKKNSEKGWADQNQVDPTIANPESARSANCGRPRGLPGVRS